MITNVEKEKFIKAALSKTSGAGAGIDNEKNFITSIALDILAAQEECERLGKPFAGATFTFKGSGTPLTVKNVVNVRGVGSDTHTKKNDDDEVDPKNQQKVNVKKSDVDLITKSGKVYGISLKKKSACAWASADVMLGPFALKVLQTMDNFDEYRGNLLGIPNGPNGGYEYKSKTKGTKILKNVHYVVRRIFWRCTETQTKLAVFGVDNVAAVIRKDWSSNPNNNRSTSDNLSFEYTCDKIICSLSDIDEMEYPYVFIINTKNRKLGGKEGIQGLRVVIKPKKYIYKTAANGDVQITAKDNPIEITQNILSQISESKNLLIDFKRFCKIFG